MIKKRKPGLKNHVLHHVDGLMHVLHLNVEKMVPEYSKHASEQSLVIPDDVSLRCITYLNIVDAVH